MKPPGIQAALLGILVSSVFASPTIVESTWPWSLAGIGAAFSVPRTRPANPRLPQWAPVMATLAAGVLVILAGLLAVPDAADQTVADAVADKDFDAAQSAFRTATAWSYGLPG